VYYDYSLSANGTREKHGHNYETDYLTDVIVRTINVLVLRALSINYKLIFTSTKYLLCVQSRKAADFLRDKSAEVERPFFMMLSPPACHAPFTPAPQYASHFADERAPQDGSFNVAGKDKHWLVREAKHPLSNESLDYIDSTFRNRWRTLLSVDDMVENVVNILTEQDQLNNTYIFLTSDHGFHLGN
jgi:N-acetylglucosamine-6-sulfatase